MDKVGWQEGMQGGWGRREGRKPKEGKAVVMKWHSRLAIGHCAEDSLFQPHQMPDLQCSPNHHGPWWLGLHASQVRQRRVEEEQPCHTLYIPYVYLALARISGGSAGSSTSGQCSRTPSILRYKLYRIRDSAMLASWVVYETPCSCRQRYMGETKRVLGTRLKEHQAATRRGETDKSAIVEHVWFQRHQPLWEETRILDQADNNTILLIKEAMHIYLQNQGS